MLRDFIGLCKLNILDEEKHKTVLECERENSGKPSTHPKEKSYKVSATFQSMILQVFSLLLFGSTWALC